jgi:multiple sugar transport system permease protein
MEGSTTDIVTRQAPSRRLPGFGGRSEKRVAQALITPGQLLMTFLVAFPAAVAIYIGFTEWTPTTGVEWYKAYRFWEWFNQYWEALTTSSFWLAIWRTVLITVVAVGIEFLLGFALALLFLKNFRLRSLLTVVFLLPMMVVPAVTGFIFYMLFQANGPVNEALTVIFPGEIRVGWLSDPSVVIWSVMIVDIWQWTPLMFLIFLSGLVALPEDQMNAARILGAGYWHQLRYLVFPMMKPIILIALIIRAMETFKLFDAAWLMTRGGPGEASSTISVYLFREVFVNARWGYATAAAIIVLIFVSVAALRAIRPIEQAQEETLEELVGVEARVPVEQQRLEEAIEAEAKV